VGILLLVNDGDIVELDVEELVHRVQLATDAQVVLQLHNHLLVNQRLEKRVEQLVRSQSKLQ